MVKCTVCGKKGLFLKVNGFGRCEKCEEQFQHIEVGKTVSGLIPDCVVTDIETSGLIYNKNSIIEIAAIKVVAGKIAGAYSSFVHRDKSLSGKITQITGITTEMLQNCTKSLETVMKEYREFIGDLPLVGHNINSFDIRFINEAYMKVWGEPVKNSCIDTLRLSYEYFDVESYKLGVLANYAGITKGTAHRALGDCETTLNLYKYMLEQDAVEFLGWSENGKDIDETNKNYPKYLKTKYPSGNCCEYHKKLISAGYLEKAKPEIALNTLKATELKEILRNHSLSPSGTKAVLISRILENVDTSLLDLPASYVPSEKGMKLLEANQISN